MQPHHQVHLYWTTHLQYACLCSKYILVKLLRLFWLTCDINSYEILYITIVIYQLLLLLSFFQAPVVPLQRPDELHIPSPSWMQTTSGYEDMSNEQGIPTMITWSYDGKEVAVEGSWDDWKTRLKLMYSTYNLVTCKLWLATWEHFFTLFFRMPLQRSGKDFTIMKVLPSGVYQYRFIVDGQWRYSPDMPWTQDDAGNAYNILDLQVIPNSLSKLCTLKSWCGNLIWSCVFLYKKSPKIKRGQTYISYISWFLITQDTYFTKKEHDRFSYKQCTSRR